LESSYARLYNQVKGTEVDDTTDSSYRTGAQNYDEFFAENAESSLTDSSPFTAHSSIVSCNATVQFDNENADRVKPFLLHSLILFLRLACSQTRVE
jgi:hypothetical protein